MINFFLLPPSPFLFALEPFNAMCDYIAGHATGRDLSLLGDGHAILVLPGFGASGSATADLRVRLGQLGYQVYDWRHGVNNGHGTDLDGWLALLGEQLREISATHDGAVSIIGWSLGGIYARELAKLHPSMVRQVVTLATPFGQATDIEPHSAGASSPIRQWFLTDSASQRRLSETPPVPSTSVYSQTDGIVNWEQCRGKETSKHRNIEVRGVSHLGMVYHPDILTIIAKLLQNPPPTELPDYSGETTGVVL